MNRSNLGNWALVAVASFASVISFGTAQAEDPPRSLILATTTSTQDSGLLDELIPLFEKKTGFRVKTIAVGTGEALKMSGRGDADVLLAHAPAEEQKYVDDGSIVNRQLVMHNNFLIVGPESDPAGIRGLENASDGMARISAAQASFVSRGDNSGTHFTEQSLWKAAGIEPSGDWYIEAGQGMGATLMIASEKQAYTLVDGGTFLAMLDRLDLTSLLEGDEVLLNLYSVSEVNPARFPKVNNVGARAFSDFIRDPDTQVIIGKFGIAKFGRPLFFPDADTVASASPNN
ncbi:MAG: substrate-binding domain-containing protein [Myxococcales bacterium]|nr:substrate-binding domain-containing protein [Myxococcales bacterium]